MIEFAELSYAEDLREIEGMRAIADASIPIGGGYAFVGPAGSWMCVAKGLGVGGRVVTLAEMRELVEVYRSRGVEPRIDVCCHADASVMRYAGELGFVAAGSELLLVRGLNLPGGGPDGTAMPGLEVAAEASLQVPAPRGMVLERVDPRDAAQVMDVARVIATGFASSSEAVTAVDLDLTARPMRAEQVVTVVARIDGELAGAGMMDAVEVRGRMPGLGDRALVSGLFALSVLPGFRRRGVQLAIMRERLRIAQARGAVFAAIGSEPSSATLRNARRMGFVIVGMKTTLVKPEKGLIGRPRGGG
jgi:predicted N-acetyltransferase YhbS